MKHSISHFLAAAAVAAALVPVLGYAGTHLVPQGRAGYTVCQDREPQMKNDTRRETNVALVMDKPEQKAPVLQNMGRAGYRYNRTRDAGR